MVRNSCSGFGLPADSLVRWVDNRFSIRMSGSNINSNGFSIIFVECLENLIRIFKVKHFCDPILNYRYGETKSFYQF
jgi:hypothetical protein